MITARSKRISLITMFTVFFLFPLAFVGAQVTGITYECPTKIVNGVTVSGECEFSHLITATLNVVDFGVKIALGFSPIVLAWAGYNYMISGDNPTKRKDANKMLWSVVVGIIFVLAAWLIVNLITNTLLGKSLDNFGIN